MRILLWFNMASIWKSHGSCFLSHPKVCAPVGRWVVGSRRQLNQLARLHTYENKFVTESCMYIILMHPRPRAPRAFFPHVVSIINSLCFDPFCPYECIDFLAFLSLCRSTGGCDKVNSRRR